MEYQHVMVMGAGAVGGFFGARIAEHSPANVTLIARGKHLQAIRESGLRICSPDGNSTVKLAAHENPREAESPDLILFTVKSYDTEEAIQAIAPVVAEHTQVLTIQNGIRNYEKLVEEFGADRVIQGFCRIGASVVKPGVVEHKSLGSVIVGEPDGSITERLRGVERLFDGTHINFKISEQIAHDIWVKFTWNCIFNMVTAVAQVTVDELFEDTASEQLCYDLFKEIKQVAAHEGITLSAADRDKIIDDSRGLEGFTPSTYNDRQKGNKLEFEAFTGTVVQLADQHGVDVPANRTLYAFLKLIS